MRRNATLPALLLCLTAPLGAQQGMPRPEPIRDNSFLVEEAYNQEAGVVQHVSTFGRAIRGGGWGYTFTQEWPVRGMRHQASATIPVSQLADGPGAIRGVGDVLLNYRYQLAGMDGGPLAVSPRVSLVLPTGSRVDGLGEGSVGVQANLPLSMQHTAHLVTHWNAGFTWTPAAQDRLGASATTMSYAASQSIVWLAHQRVNLLVETAWARVAAVAGDDATVSADELYVAPGIRWSHDLPRGLQVVPGIAVPFGIGPSRGERSLFAYLSFEHPF